MPAIKLREFICPGCGLREIRKTRQTSIYCSRVCWLKNRAGQYLKTGKEITCIVCSSTVYRRGAWTDKKFCSRVCYEKSRAVSMKACRWCNVSFIPKNKISMFCSRQCSKRGALNPHWRGGIEQRKILSDDKAWRTAVFERDSYTCAACGQYGGKISAHHKDAYHWCKDRRFDVSNGVTLCLSCHRDFHSKYGTHGNTEKQWQEFVVMRVDFSA